MSSLHSILLILILGLSLLLILKQISFQTTVKWLLGIGFLFVLVIPAGRTLQTKFGNWGFFIVIFIFLVVFLAKFSFSRGVMQKTTASLITGYFKYFLVVTGIASIVIGLINLLAKWLKQ